MGIPKGTRDLRECHQSLTPYSGALAEKQRQGARNAFQPWLAAPGRKTWEVLETRMAVSPLLCPRGTPTIFMASL